MDNYSHRRRSSLLHHTGGEQEHQPNCHEDTSKQPLHHCRFSPTNDNKSKTQDRQIGDADTEDGKEQQYRAAVDSLGPYDVICGRGSVAFNNIGNRRFRVLISMNVDRYNNSVGRHRKGLFIGSLVHTFQHTIGARFFKLKDGQLIELTERQIRQKVGHALRDVLAFQDSQLQQQQRIQNHQLQRQATSRSTSPTANTRKKEYTRTMMSASQATLSAIRSRLHEIRKESDNIRLQTHAIPSPLPFTSTKPCIPQYEIRKNVSSNSRDHHTGGAGTTSHNAVWHRNTDTKIEDSSSSNYTSVYPNGYKNNGSNSFDRQNREISDSLEPIPIDDHRDQYDEALELLKF